MAALRFGFGEHQLERIISVMAPWNTAARRVMERIGLQEQGVRQWKGLEVVCYAPPPWGLAGAWKVVRTASAGHVKILLARLLAPFTPGVVRESRELAAFLLLQAGKEMKALSTITFLLRHCSPVTDSCSPTAITCVLRKNRNASLKTARSCLQLFPSSSRPLKQGQRAHLRETHAIIIQNTIDTGANHERCL